MSLSEFFNKKARAIIAAGAFALGGLGGYAGHEAAQQQTQPAISEFTLAQLPENITEQQFYAGKLPAGTVVTPESQRAQAEAVAGFTARISALQNLSDRDAQTEAAVAFVNDLRVSENLSERDYTSLVKDYNARVGLDVTPLTGNWQKGIMYQQEANLAVHFGELMGNFFGGDDDESTPQQLSRDVGAVMTEGQQRFDVAGAAGAGGGALLGSLLLAPLWLRARRGYPKVQP